MFFTWNFFKAFLLFLGALCVLEGFAQAAPTHLGKVELVLQIVDDHGKTVPVKKVTSDFRLDWKTGKCEIQVLNQFAFCTLDVNQDLKDKDGDLLVRALPQAKFDSRLMAQLGLLLSQENENVRKSLTEIAKNANAEANNFFSLPFYTCEACEKVKGRTPVWNTFQSYVLREVKLNDKISLSLKLYQMKPVRGSFRLNGYP